MKKYLKNLYSIAIITSVVMAVWLVSTTHIALAGEENNHEVKNINQAPGSQALGRALDNTDLYRVMVRSVDIKKKHIEKHSNVKSKLIEKRIEKGLEYLHEKQLPNGQFPSYISYSQDMSNGINMSMLFDTAFIAHTLNLAGDFNDEDTVQTMKTKTMNFLMENKESHGVWKVRGKSEPAYPPDTDTTAIAFSALIESGVNINDETLDYMLGFRTSEGVFYTWINSEEWLQYFKDLDPSSPFYEFYIRVKNNDIEPTVNADVLYAYSLRNRPQSGVIRYLNGIAENKTFINGTLYYPSPYVFTYLVTKAYSEGSVKELEPSIANIKDFIISTQKPDGSWGNDLNTALATVSLLNTGYEGKPLDEAIEHILDSQSKNGTWSSHAFYNTGTTPPLYYGSQELTTSFNLEALIKYKNTIDDKNRRTKDMD